MVRIPGAGRDDQTSPSGSTVGYELYKAIGCPGKGLLDAGCPVPPLTDSDGDGIVDSMDACPAVFAKTANGCPVAPKPLTLDGVNFDHDRSTLRHEASATLDQAAASLKEWGDVKVEVAGHTDSRGSYAYNMRLSQRRAEAVRAYLIGKGVAAERLSARGYGESRPVADNATEGGRYKNRRVELVPQP